MTTTVQTRTPPGRYGLAQAARMEWIKLRSLRSTWWTLIVTVAGTVGIGVAVGLNSRDASVDVTNNALAGVVPGLLLAGALGVLTMTGEYSSGTIRATLAAVPRRPLRWRAEASPRRGRAARAGRKGRACRRGPGARRRRAAVPRSKRRAAPRRH